MKLKYMIPGESGLTGVRSELATALVRHREDQESGKTFTFDVREDPKLVAEHQFSTVHHKTGLSLAALGPQNRRLLRRWLDEYGFEPGASMTKVSIHPPCDEHPNPDVFQVVLETSPLHRVYHFSPMKAD